MRDHIIAVAEKLFYSEGSRTIGVDRIIAEAGIAKATLYRHFPGKTDLVEAYLQTRHERIVEVLTGQLLGGEATPQDRLLRIFDLLAEKAGTPPFRGCAFLIAVAENEASEPVLAVAREHKRAIRSLLEGIAQALPVDAAQLADHIALCYEGALASIAVKRVPTPAYTARRCAEILIDAAIRTRVDDG